MATLPTSGTRIPRTSASARFDPPPLREVLDANWPRVERHHGSKRGAGHDRDVRAGELIGHQPVDGQARPDPVIHPDPAGEHGRACRHVSRWHGDAGFGKVRRRRLEPAELEAGQVRILDRLEVGPQALEPDPWRGTDLPGSVDQPIPREAATTESGLDLQLDTERRTAVPGHRAQQLVQQHWISRRGGHTRLCRVGGQGRRDRVQDQQRAPDAPVSELKGLVERGDTEPVGSSGFEHRCHRYGPVTIGVRLHHGTNGHGAAGQAPERREVVPQGADIDLEPDRAREWR
jgi:hypothetical protein